MSIVAPIKFNSAPVKISGVPVKIGDGTVKISVALVPVLLTPLVHERGTVQGRDLVGIVEGPCGYRARGVSIREKIVLSRNPWYKTKAVAMRFKRSSDPRSSDPQVPYHEVQVRDLVRVVVIVARIAPRGSSIRGKFVLSSPRGYSAQETCAGRPQQRYATGEPGNVQGRDRVGIVEGGPAVSVREKSFNRKTLGTRQVGSPYG